MREEAPRRTRMTQDERRRQLVGIGLRMLVERPIQELAIDEVAKEAGISRGLLFHYFPNKTAFHEAVVAAAARRVLRNTAPDEGLEPWAAVAQFVERYLEQVERRRDSYLALVFGGGPVTLDGALVADLRASMGERVRALLDLSEVHAPTTRSWTAYVEDRALNRTPVREGALAEETDHCVRALRALLDLDPPE
ncbi:TetR/AcrR family transcriptional regulator [Nocardiopsis sp. JB363]|uniref:TetR/AcrR family transcriptional regulator n=1 Tax=Nocardiopsis sp. JB363 TaxID=1434837 RepID=UPI001F2BDD94|nr:TetR/AcrR family transcriptional regulator [Nocardiopsis sp. JB363]